MTKNEVKELRKIVTRIYEQSVVTGMTTHKECKAEMLVIQNLCNKAFKIVGKPEPTHSETLPPSFHAEGDLEC